MGSQITRLKIAIIVIAVLSLAIVIVVPPYLVTGVTSEVGSEGIPTSIYDFPPVPQDVADEADRLANELFGEYQERCDEFVRQLLVTYSEAKDKDFVIFFNSGGAGWNLVETSLGWYSIFDGITHELANSGYTSLSLNYLRTTRSWQGFLDESMNMISLYPAKTKELAGRVEFLIKYIPDLRVILTGESNGTVICDRVQNALKDNPRVYSIQTGPPFWYKNTKLDRKLVLTSNGIIPDSFSRGDLLTMICTTLENMLGFSQQQYAGHILNHVGAPGHDYWWQYPEVYSQITSFLDKNFGLK
jgi:hypothetical protein